MHGLRSVLLVGSLTLVSADAHAKCAMLAIVTKPLTAANTAIGPGGGVVVGLVFDGRADGRAIAVEQPGWRFKQGGKLSEPKIKILAPSLAVYEFAGEGGTLVDDKKKALVTVRRGKEPAALTVPTVRAASAQVDDEPTKRWSSGSQLTIELAAAPPPGVLGIIVYVGKTPQNWAVLEPKNLNVRFDAGGHCANDLPGALLPTTGDITVAWFDGTGRVSAPSAAVTIKKSPKP